jgi:hypothetical protein
MMNLRNLPLSAILLVSLTSVGQQTSSTPPTPQPTSAAASTVPCNKTIAPPPRPGWLEKKARALACQKDKQFCDAPSSSADLLGGIPDAKPCPANTVAGQTPVKAQPQQPPAPTAAQASATANSKPALVCPPKATLIPGFPYCLKPDHTTVDAIPLPANLSAPASPASAAPAPVQH